MKITKAPAIANELTSTPINLSILFPINKNEIINNPATIAAFYDSILPNFCLSETMTGTDPRISITANKTINAVIVSLTENCSKNSIIVTLKISQK